MQEFQIGTNEAGQRLDKFLHKYLQEATTSFLYKMLRKKNITLNKKKADGKEILKVNDHIQFFFSEETFLKFRGKVSSGENDFPMKKQTDEYSKAYKSLNNIEVIFENKHIVLVNKPAGVLSQKSMPKDLSLNEWLIGYLLEKKEISVKQLETYKPSICNRLDRNTSGLVICGKSLLGSQTMNQLIKERKIRKFYRTFAKGCISKKEHVKGYIKKDEKTNTVIFRETLPNDDNEFQLIETAYYPLINFDGYTYVEVELITGKTHQIRAHLAGKGHPLLGDEKYGDRKWNQSFSHFMIPKWQLLHSYRLEFPIMEGEFADLSLSNFEAKEPAVYEKLKK